MYSIGNVFVTTIHVLSAILAIGGVAFLRFVAFPYAAGLSEADRKQFMQGIHKRFVPILHGSFLFLILTGIHHITRLIRSGLVIPPVLIVKIVIALTIIFIGVALTLPKGFDGMKKNPKMWLTVNLTLAVVVVFFGIRVTH